MAVDALESKDGRACLYCTTTGWVFGPLFASADAAYAFLPWLAVDPRMLPDLELERVVRNFHREMVCVCGELRRVKCTYCDSNSWDAAVNDMHADDYGDPVKCELQYPPASDTQWTCDDCKQRKMQRKAQLARK